MSISCKTDAMPIMKRLGRIAEFVIVRFARIAGKEQKQRIIPSRILLKMKPYYQSWWFEIFRNMRKKLKKIGRAIKLAL